jgi:hypothetical protein
MAAKKKPTKRKRPTTMSRAIRIHGLLSGLHRDLARGGKEGPLTLTFHPGGEASEFARALVDAFRANGGAVQKSTPFIRGRVYCFHCDTASCEHAVPTDHLSVFSGYTPTGFPVWTEFFSVVLDTKDPRIDDLVKEDADIVALCQDMERLKEEQLQIFGKESPIYDIRGQVAAGYLTIPRQSRTAITVQAVRCRVKGKTTMELNVIGRTPEGVDLVEHLKLEPDPELTGLFKAARKRLGELRYRAGNGSRDAAVLSILRKLGRGIERTQRRSRRRTRHASARRTERPAVGLAMKDIKTARSDHFLCDELHHTFIVVGPKWRIHVFGHDGRHVTSMTLNKESFQRRLDQRRWRYATKAEMTSIREKVAEAS